jgi:parallel beta-helix repeat protein
VLDATGRSAGFLINGKIAVRIEGFVVFGAVHGIYIKSGSDHAVVSNNIVTGCSGNGVYVQDSKNVLVFNNLVYGNGRSGVLVTGNVTGSPNACLSNNTVYANGNRGIFISGTSVGSPGALVVNNITSGNAVAGYQVNESSLPAFLSGGNVIGDRVAHGTLLDPTDRLGDPGFIDPAGPDNSLGGLGFADDDFRLSHPSTGQSFLSIAVDAGVDSARSLGLSRATTRKDGRPDRGWVDAGYHYGNSNTPSSCASLRLLRYRNLYVDPANGADDRAGLTRDTAFRSLAKALSIARAGHRVVLLSNATEANLSFGNSGRPGREIILHALPGTLIDANGQGPVVTLGAKKFLRLYSVTVSGGTDGLRIRTGSEQITLDSVTVRGNQVGIRVSDSSRLSIRNTKVLYNSSRGVVINGGDMRLSGTLVARNGGDGCWALNGAAVTVQASNFTSNAGNGIVVEAGSLTAESSAFKRNRQAGILLKNGATASLVRLAVTDNDQAGLSVFSSSVTAQDILASRNHREGILAADSTLQLSQVQASQNQRQGIFASSGTIQVTGGILENNQQEGIRINDGARASLVRLAVTDNDQAGLSVFSSSVTAQDILASRNHREGILAADSTLQLSQVQASQNQRQGIFASSGTIQVTGGILENNQQEGIRINGGTVVLNDIRATSNLQEGISLRGISSGQVRGAQAISNQGHGLQILNGGFVEIDDCSFSGNVLNGLTLEETKAVLKHCSAEINRKAGFASTTSEVEVEAARFLSNQLEGLVLSGGSAQLRKLEVTDNGQEGVRATNVTELRIEFSRVGRNRSNGLQIVNANASAILSTVVFSNAGRGVLIWDSPEAFIWNNLVYANGSTGIAVDGSITGSYASRILQNTVAFNNNRGVLIGGADTRAPSEGAVVRRNIFAGNQPHGLQVNRLSLPGYTGDYNLASDSFGPGTPLGLRDTVADPLFILPAGADGIIGGQGDKDDDFRLSQRAAGQARTSPAVDAGDVSALEAGVASLTTRTDHVPDQGAADLGYHYPIPDQTAP